MIADLFFIFSLVLFMVRIIEHNSLGTHWVAVDILSGFFMFLAMYYYLFIPPVTAIEVINVYNVPACNATACRNVTETFNASVIQDNPAILVNSYGFILVVTATIFYIILMGIFALRDFILRRSSFR